MHTHNRDKRRRQLIGLTLVCLLLGGCQTTLPTTAYDPSQGWQVAPAVEDFADGE